MSYAHTQRMKAINRGQWDLTRTLEKRAAWITLGPMNPVQRFQATRLRLPVRKPNIWQRIKQRFSVGTREVTVISRQRRLKLNNRNIKGRIKRTYILHPTKGFRLERHVLCNLTLVETA